MEAAKHHPKKFDIIIDHKPFEWSDPFITGTDIKHLVGAPKEYGAWLIVPGPAEDEEVNDEERIDLRPAGRERFITGPKKSTEGSPASFLPERDRAYLTSKALIFEEVAAADGQRGVILRKYALPDGQFDAERADLLILIPAGYPDTAPDMFYLLPWLKLSPGNALPKAADQPHQFAGQSWQRWSRHNSEWRGGVDGIWTMLKRVDCALESAAA